MFWSSFRGVTYNSNHIEGSRLTHDQTRYIFETNTIGFENESVNVDDVIETANHFRCIDMVIEQAGNTFIANGVTYEPIAKDGLYYVELPGVNPQDWDAEQVLTVSNGNTLTVGYSPMNYIVRMHEKDSLSTFLKAMYNYHLAAKALCTE